MKKTGLVLLGIVLVATVASAYEVRPLDWSKLKGGASDELAAMCATVMEHTQDGMGRDWLEKIEKTERVDGLLDFGYIDSKRKKGRRRAMEDCIRPMTTTARTLAMAICAGQYRADKAGAELAEIEKLFPLVIRSLAMDHNVNGGIGKDTWGDSWQSAMWAGQLAQAAWIVWDQLEPADREPVIRVLVHEADRYLDVAPPVSNKKSVEDTKGEENKWNSGCLLAAATMLRNHPHEAAWREQAIVYFLNAVATPHDVGSSTVVDGKPLSERLRGYCITKDYAVGNHGAYPHPGYTSASYLDIRGILFCTLAGVQPPEAALYNAAPIYRMYVDHEWKAPPCVAPGGTIYRKDGGIYWPVKKEAERAGRYYLWFKQDVMADTFGFDADCSVEADYWAKLHGQCMVDALTGKPTPAKLESYHKGAFFKNALASYLIRVLHANSQLAPDRALSAGDLDWPVPKTEDRPGSYWWWMGSAVDKENITWNLKTMRKAGMGGGTIVPIYGVKGYEDKYIQHLSPEFVDMVSHATKEAKRLGMWVDMTTGTGWPFGGPMMEDKFYDASVDYTNGELSHKFSGRYVKRSAAGNEGKAINPYSAKAMEYYLKHFDEPFGKEGVVMPRAMYHDSFEFKGNWCEELPEAFKKRRGYDLMEHLPELFHSPKSRKENKKDKKKNKQSDAGKTTETVETKSAAELETIARIKCDYRETLSDLHLDYLKVWAEWSASKGCGTRNQAHGSPSNLLDLYAASSIPETETFSASVFKIPGIRREEDNVRKDMPQPLINRMASSAAHVTGKPLVASESCTWIRNHFRAALSQIKPEVDQLLLNGINHIFFHGTCYSPKDATWPGWLFYASLQYNPRNAIWRDTPYLNAYITRCQSILQSGKPDNDVAVYWPVYDIWHDPTGMQQKLTVRTSDWLTEAQAGKAALQLKEEGFGYDFISDRQLLAGLGDSYKAVVVPKTGHMPVATLEKLLGMSASGQPVIFVNSLPADVPGFNKLEERRAELEALLAGQEKLVVEAADLKTALGKTEVRREPMVDQGIDFIRRKHETGCHYFIANMSAQSVDGWIELGVPFKSVAIMDAQSSKSGMATDKSGKIYLQLKPGETRILRTFDDRTVDADKWPLLTSAGEPLTVEGEWKIDFIDGGPVLPADMTAKDLKSWTEIGDAEAKRFAGTARYSIDVEVPGGVDQWEIDLGDVRESARVFINGKEAVALYSFPYSAPLGKHLKAGNNLLEIEVTNLSANRLRDLDVRKVEWKKYHEINFVNQHYRRFDASGWPLTPSGLLGAVTLTPMKELDPYERKETE